MNQVVLSDEFLKKAVEIAHEKWISAFPAPEYCEHDFPEGFFDKILWEAKKHDRIKTVTRRVAAAIITILISGAVLLAVNPNARAIVRKWFLEVFDNHIVYHFNEDSELSELPNYVLSYVPEGFEEVDGLTTQNRISKLYLNLESGDSFLFECSRMVDGNHIEINTDMAQTYELIIVGDLEIYFYHSDDVSDTNNLIWFDEDNQLVFTIDSNLDQSVMLNIFQGIVLDNSTNLT